MIAGPSGRTVLILLRLPWVNETYYYNYLHMRRWIASVYRVSLWLIWICDPLFLSPNLKLLISPGQLCAHTESTTHTMSVQLCGWIRLALIGSLESDWLATVLFRARVTRRWVWWEGHVWRLFMLSIHAGIVSYLVKECEIQFTLVLCIRDYLLIIYYTLISTASFPPATVPMLEEAIECRKFPKSEVPIGLVFWRWFLSSNENHLYIKMFRINWMTWIFFRW